LFEGRCPPKAELAPGYLGRKDFEASSVKINHAAFFEYKHKSAAGQYPREKKDEARPGLFIDYLRVCT
jgi:hypothetical protein